MEETKLALLSDLNKAGKTGMSKRITDLLVSDAVRQAIALGMESVLRLKQGEPGDMIAGEYLGARDGDFVNPDTGEITIIKIHAFRVANGIVIEISGGYDLDNMHATHGIDVGDPVVCIFNNRIPIKGGTRQKNDWTIFGPPGRTARAKAVKEVAGERVRKPKSEGK